MVGQRLTTKGIEAMKPDPDKRLEVPDPGCPGLYLIIQPSGSKGWAARYRFAGRSRKLTLGKWPRLGLADARGKALEAFEAVEKGTDPAQAKAQREEAQRDTVAALLGLYRERYLSQLKSGETVARELERHVGARWGHRPVKDIARRDVLELLEEIAGSGRVTTANRLRSYLGRFFGWLLERDVIATSPMTGVRRLGKEKARERVLNDDEIRWFWRACEIVGQPWGPIGRVLLLTGQRLGEVSGLRDSELRGDLWHLPAERVKNGRSHDVPLSGLVLEEIATLERIKGADLLFTTTGTTAPSGYDTAIKRLRREMARIASEETGEDVEIPHWTFHDLRRTCATGLARLGIAVRVTEAVLNHVSGSGGGIVAVYQRHDFAHEKRSALNAWSRFVLDLYAPEDRNENVVRISK
ncbi:integrase arm-type DNA-binding domain-containing protein [Mameliella alba]|uniref:tyrosine-type recombinase/integrase n=1 Tax=Mameliella alba TaxID=561184 RepID=UPI001C985339|nr:site-specific integrase [Mameliella alba]MBY6119812.1 integrase arm-type DNA-binding domain-containing protein [Mameliella alba]